MLKLKYCRQTKDISCLDHSIEYATSVANRHDAAFESTTVDAHPDAVDAGHAGSSDAVRLSGSGMLLFMVLRAFYCFLVDWFENIFLENYL